MQIFQHLKNNPNIRDSLLLHLLLLLLFTFGIGFSIDKSSIISAPIIVDLSEIKIAEKTNLPAKTSKAETSKKTTYSAPKPKPKVEKTVKAEKKSETALVGKEKVKKTEPKKQPPKPAPKKSSDSLNSLLASVEKMQKDAAPAPVSEINKLTDGIVSQGASRQIGNPELALTLGQKDAIASKLRACWNIDAGAKGVLDMTVGIKTSLSRDGKVAEVEIENSARYNSDQVFRAIADSARRAVYVCDKKGEESPFKILSKYYPNEYNMWKELYLQFNPLDGGIF